MFGTFSTRDLPVVALILALALVERVVEAGWVRAVAAVAAVSALVWLLAAMV